MWNDEGKDFFAGVIGFVVGTIFFGMIKWGFKYLNIALQWLVDQVMYYGRLAWDAGKRRWG